MAAAGLAFDVGRFYSERRYLQNAADAGALAIANALIRGESATDAEAEGRDVLDPQPGGQPDRDHRHRRDHARVRARPRRRPGLPDQRRPDHVGRRRPGRRQERRDLHLRPGRSGWARRSSAGRRVSKTKGDLLPIAVRHYINAPGPFAGAVSPCDGNENHFQDLIATANTACLGSTTDGVAPLHPEPGRGVQRRRPRMTTRSTTDRSSPSSARAPRPRTPPASAASSRSTSATSVSSPPRTSSTTG